MADEQNFTPLQRAQKIEEICRANGVTAAQIQTDAALCARIGIDPAEVASLRDQLQALQRANEALGREKAAAEAQVTAVTGERDAARGELTAQRNAALQKEFDGATRGANERTTNAARVQLELKRAGLLEGNIDGRFGDATRAALGKVTDEVRSSNPALVEALGKLDVNGYNAANKTAIEAARGTPAAPVAAPATPTPPTRPADAPAAAPAAQGQQALTQEQRIAKIKEAQGALFDKGHFGQGVTREQAVDGVIGARTRAAMTRGNEAVVKATANAPDGQCPENMRDVARATETLREIGGNSTQAQTTPQQPRAEQPRTERPAVAQRPAREEPAERPRQPRAEQPRAERPAVAQRPAGEHGVAAANACRWVENNFNVPNVTEARMRVTHRHHVTGQEAPRLGVNGNRADCQEVIREAATVKRELNDAHAGRRTIGSVLRHNRMPNMFAPNDGDRTIGDVRQHEPLGRPDIGNIAATSPRTRRVGTHVINDPQSPPPLDPRNPYEPDSRINQFTVTTCRAQKGGLVQVIRNVGNLPSGGGQGGGPGGSPGGTGGPGCGTGGPGL